MWDNIHFTEIMKLLIKPPDMDPELELLFLNFNGTNIHEIIEKIKDRDKVRKMTTLYKKVLPGLYNVMVHERDLFMINSLSKCAGSKVVGVVGLGHLDGIEKYWNEKHVMSK